MTDQTTEQLLIVIDRDRCVGHGRCYSLAAAVFESDDEGFPEFVEGDVVSDPERERLANIAVAACPEKAISLRSS